MPKKKSSPWGIVLAVVVSLFVISFIFASVISLILTEDSAPSDGNVALVPLIGPIVGSTPGGFVDTMTSDDVIALLEKAEANPQVKAIVIEINSPGGSPVASEEIAYKIRSINKTTVAWIRDVGASGAYWAASAADHVVASRLSVVGSIGVIGSYLEFSGLLDNYSIEYQRLVGGEFKDIGSPFKDLTPSERFKLQERINKMHDHFAESVADFRGLDQSMIQTVDSGLFYLGQEALDLGLIDEIGSRQEALDYIRRTHDIEVKVAEYHMAEGIFDILRKISKEHGFSLGKGIGSELAAAPKTGIELLMN